MDLDELFGEAWCVTLAPRPVTETLHLMGVPNPENLDHTAHVLQAHAAGGASLLGRAMPNGWTLTIECESWTGFDDDVLRTLAANGRTALSAYRDPDTKTATIAHDGAVLGHLDLSGGYFDGPSGSADTTHPVIASLAAAGFDASDTCQPTGEADTEEPEGRLLLAIRVLTGITLTTADVKLPGTAGFSRTAFGPGLRPS